MDTVIIGGVKYTTESLLDQTITLLQQLKNITHNIETDEEFYKVNNILDELEDLINDLD